MVTVLFLIKAREFGGLEIVLLDWLSQTDFTKVAVTIACYGTDTLDRRLAATGFPVQTIKLTLPDREPAWKALPKWRRLISSIAPHKTVFLEGKVGEFGVTPVLAAWRATSQDVFLFEANWGQGTLPNSDSKKTFGFLPNLGLYRLKEVLKQRIRGALARHTFVVSQQVKDNLIARYGYNGSKTSVLYHGVDIQRFRPSPTERFEFRRKYGISEDAIVIVSHGRIAPRKRIDRIIAAFDVLRIEHPNLWLLFTSYGPFKDEVEKMAAGSAFRDQIKLIEFQENVSLMLKASDIYVLASDDEGFGIALVEALSCGLLSVATRGPGPLDIVRDGDNGILVEPTSEGVLNGLRRALAISREDRSRIAARARETVEKRFEITSAIQHALDSMEIPRC